MEEMRRQIWANMNEAERLRTVRTKKVAVVEYIKWSMSNLWDEERRRRNEAVRLKRENMEKENMRRQIWAYMNEAEGLRTKKGDSMNRSKSNMWDEERRRRNEAVRLKWEMEKEKMRRQIWANMNEAERLRTERMKKVAEVESINRSIGNLWDEERRRQNEAGFLKREMEKEKMRPNVTLHQTNHITNIVVGPQVQGMRFGCETPPSRRIKN